MNNYYFTFSKHSIFKGQFLKVSASNRQQAIRAISEEIGNAWDTLYTEEEYMQLIKS